MNETRALEKQDLDRIAAVLTEILAVLKRIELRTNPPKQS